jgi:hypothetical protein
VAAFLLAVTPFTPFDTGLVYKPCYTTDDGLVLPRSSCEEICYEGLSPGGACEFLGKKDPYT